MRHELTAVRISRIVSALFLTTVAGGVLGIVAPYLEFRSLVELLLPAPVANQEFVNKLIHPAASQIMTVLGYESPRPSAPFEYTNIWGLNFAVTLPFFVFSWFGKSAGWRRWLAPFILAVAVVPAVFSLNRGMWAALAAMGLFMVVRSTLAGRPTLAVAVLGVVGLLIVLLNYGVLGSIVQARFSNEGSEQGRSNLSALTVRSVIATSPLIGLGSTRTVQGNFNSIAGGATADCPRCTPPALGTQGQVWLVIYSQGVLGLLFYLVFFGRFLVTGCRSRSSGSTVAACVLIAAAITLPFYNAVGTALMVMMLAVALIARDEGAGSGQSEPGSFRSLGPTDVSTRAAPLIAALTTVGLMAGTAFQMFAGVPVSATQPLVLSSSNHFTTLANGPMTIDTEAQLTRSATVRRAVGKATGHSFGDVSRYLTVTAAPNTRVLHLSYIDKDASRALAGVIAASQAVLDQRQEQITARIKTQVEELRMRARAAARQVKLLDDTLKGLRRAGTANVGDTRSLLEQRGQALTQLQEVNQRLVRTLGQSVRAGATIRSPHLVKRSDRWLVSVTSGGLLGLMLAVLILRSKRRRGARIRERSDVVRYSGLPVLAQVPASLVPRPLRSRAAAVVRWRGIVWRRRGAADGRRPVTHNDWSLASSLFGIRTVVPARRDVHLARLADELSRAATEAGRGETAAISTNTAILVSRDCHVADLEIAREVAEHHSGRRVVGVVLCS